ncbi:hypothetical protein ACFVZ3_13720, partial [Kitasatospora purpeofusca]
MPAEYTRDLLAEKAAAAASLDEMLVALGREPNKDRRKYLRRKLTEFAVDTSHFHPGGSVYTRELLQEAVDAHRPNAGAVRHPHHPQARGTHAHTASPLK